MHWLAFFLSAMFVIGSQSASISMDADDVVIYYTSENDGSGNYAFSFETANGTRRQETGRIINAGQPDQYTLVEGSYSYKDTNDQEHTVYYAADKNGFHILPAAKQDEIGPVVYALPPSVVASLLG